METRTEKRVRGGICLGPFLSRKGAEWRILSYLPRRDACIVPSAAGVRAGARDQGRGEQRQGPRAVSAQPGLPRGPRRPPFPRAARATDGQASPSSEKPMSQDRP